MALHLEVVACLEIDNFQDLFLQALIFGGDINAFFDAVV